MTIMKFERRSCDRCGTTMEVADQVNANWERMGFPDYAGGFTGCGGIPPIVDLCPNCRKSLIIWWREKRSK